MTAPGSLHICCECELAVFIGLPCAFLTLLHHLCFFSYVRLSCPTSACGLLSWLIAFCSDMFDFCLLDSCSRRLGRVYLRNREDDENLGEIEGGKLWFIYIAWKKNLYQLKITDPQIECEHALSILLVTYQRQWSTTSVFKLVTDSLFHK